MLARKPILLFYRQTTLVGVKFTRNPHKPSRKSFLPSFFSKKRKSDKSFFCNFSLFKPMDEAVYVGGADIAADDVVAVDEDVSVDGAVVIGVICNDVGIAHDLLFLEA